MFTEREEDAMRSMGKKDVHGNEKYTPHAFGAR
jgi:hypothetical protein